MQKDFCKKALYQRIVCLQSFRSCYSAQLHHPRSFIFECTKVTRHKDKPFEKYITFFLSDELKPEIEDLGLFDLEYRLLQKSDIDRYVSECKQYGIL